ncbi:hypothetical protein J5N97_029112 [Dioscorea zingiberensis]|uniref:Uncharacterized protein n=1 Tax=Dioscorea zingiberensis TaxID=325984 RepID=A0A9D5H5L4_9LILI|nr:hypothetical protein J5N97_029112 [Dioscorea zingiberensis]
MARKWQKVAALGRRISSPRADECSDFDACSTSSVPEKGHFFVYSSEGKRFMVPLAYLDNDIFKELLKKSAEEFGLASNGPITLPCDAVSMDEAGPSRKDTGKKVDMQDMQIDSAGKDMEKTDEQEESLRSDAEKDEEFGYKWIRAGSRRDRGSGRGRGRGRGSVSWRSDVSDQRSMWTKNRKGNEHVANTEVLHTSRRGRGGLTGSHVFDARDIAFPDLEATRADKNLYLTECPKLAISPAALESAAPIASPTQMANQLAVVTAPKETPQLQLVPVRSRPEGHDPGESSSADQRSTSPSLITSLKLKTRSQAVGNQHDSVYDQQLAAHDCLVQRITQAIAEKTNAQSSDAQAMDEEEPDKDHRAEIFDDDMPLALVQKDAKQEAIARRTAIRIKACPKKGRVLAVEDDSCS